MPTLVRRIAGEIFGIHDVVLPSPHRVKRNQMPLGDALFRAARVQSARIPGRGGVVVVADADDDCAVTLATRFRELAKPVEVEVAIAVREFEAWFLAGFEPLVNHRAVRDDASYSGDPETPRAAKGALSALMLEPYRETIHQPAFAALVDLNSACRVRSFEHLVSCVERLVVP